jgi:hypothetical protein
MASVESQASKQDDAPLQNYNEDAEQLATLAEAYLLAFTRPLSQNLGIIYTSVRL